MSVTTLTRPDLTWIRKFLQNYEDLLEEYPELFSVEDIEDIKIVRQIVEDAL